MSMILLEKKSGHSSNREASTENLSPEKPRVRSERDTAIEPPPIPAGCTDADATQHVRLSGAVQGARAIQRIAGYEVLDELGRGGMGVVYKAWQRSLERTVALKMILAGNFASPQDLERFRAEAMAIARLHHPHLLSIFEIGESSDLPFYSMEYMEGGSLSRRLNGQPVSPTTAAKLVRTLAQAMDYAHKNGIVHRDLKPANILLSGDATVPLDDCVAKITDFGIAKHLHQDNSCTKTGDILGTPHYMAPEQAAGNSSQVGPAADVYSLGAILYELLTGRAPFEGLNSAQVLLMLTRGEPERPSHWTRGIPRDLETICLKCLEKSQQRRYASAGALAEDLLRFIRHEPVHARPASVLNRTVKWTKRRPALAAILLMGISLVLVSIGMLAMMWWQAREHAQEQEASLLASKSLLADAYLERGIHLAEKGDVRRGMHWMMRSLEITEDLKHQTGLPQPLASSVRMNLSAWGQCVAPREMQLSHDHWVWDVAFSPDQKYVLTASRDKKVQIWSAETGKPVGPPLLHSHPVWGAVFHPDGKTLITICGDLDQKGGSLCVWSPHSSRPGHFVPRGQPLAFPHDLMNLKVGPQGDRLWVGSRAGLAYLIEFNPAPAEGNGARILGNRLPGCHQQGTFSPDGSVLTTIPSQFRDDRLQPVDQLCVWDPRTGESVGEPLKHPGAVRSTLFSLDGKYVITGCATRESFAEGECSSLQVWDIARRSILRRSAPLQGRIKTTALSPSGQIFAVSLYEYLPLDDPEQPKRKTQVTDGQVLLWQLHADGGIEPYGTPLRPDHVVWHMQFSPDNRMLLAGSENSGAFLWSVANCQPLMPPIWHDGNCIKVAFSANGRLAVTASAGGNNHARARLWHLPEFHHIGLPLPQPDKIRTVFWSNDDNQVWISSGKSHCRWDLDRGAMVDEFHTPRYAYRVVPTGDDKHFLYDLGIHRLHTFDRNTGVLQEMPYHGTAPQASSNRRYHAGKKLTIVYWHNPARYQLLTLDGKPASPLITHPTHELMEFRFNDAGDRIVFSESPRPENTNAEVGHRLLVCDTKDLSVVREIPTKQSARCLAFSRDGNSLAFGGKDRQAQRVDLRSGNLIGVPLLHEAVVEQVEFLADDRHLITGVEKGLIQLWDAQTGKRIGPAFDHRTALISLAVHPKGTCFLTGTTGRMAMIWRCPEPAQGSLSQLRLWVETLTAMEMTDQDVIVPLEMDRVVEKRQLLSEMNGAAGG